MSISRKFAASQVARLAGTEYFGALSDEAVLELQRALSTAPNEAIAVVVINDWLTANTERPTPADLYRLIRHHGPKPEYWSREYPEPEPLSDEEREEIAALQRKIDEMGRRGKPLDFAITEAKKLRQERAG